MEFVLNKLSETITVNEIANVHFFEFQKEFSTKNDKHPFSELIFVSSGTLFVKSEDFNGELKKGEMIIHPSNTYHSLSCFKDNSPTVIIIGFRCDSRELLYFSNHIVKLKSKDIDALSEIIKEGRNVFLPPYDKPTYNMKKRDKKAFASEQILKIMLEYFLISLIRKYCYYEKQENDTSTVFSISEITDYLDTNFLEKIKLDELAFLFKTNRTTLCKEFKNSVGKSILSYINGKKTEYAKTLLITTNKPINEIANYLKFDSPNHFTRFIIENTGITPKQFREKGE